MRCSFHDILFSFWIISLTMCEASFGVVVQPFTLGLEMCQ